jgi:predicted transposase YdaD
MKKSTTKNKKILSPHDKLFKKSLENPEAAEHFVKRYMPQDLLPLVNLTTLELQHITFIEDDFKSSASDVIFCVDTINGEKSYLYCLFEHQRKAEKLMPFRLLKYMVHLMDLHQRKYKTETLPLVAPLVIYNGESRYPYSMDLFDLFDDSMREKARNTLVKPYPLLDLSHYNTDDVKDDAWIASLLIALKYGASKKVSPKVLVENLRFSMVELAIDGKLFYIDGILRYINEVQPFEAREELWDELQETFQPILGDNYMMSIADSLREEGMQQGMQQAAKNFLASGVDINLVAQNTGLDITLLQKLKEETKH